MALTFGTDGVRGRAHDELTVEFVRALGGAAAAVLGGDRFLVGRDTRESGPALATALVEGLAGHGCSVVDLGVVPTPAVAWLAAADSLPAAMISASHNPFGDNGVKLFAAGGTKLSDEVQERVQHELERLLLAGPTSSTSPVPVVDDGSGLVGRWQDAVVGSLEGRTLAGLSVVIDCANGSASAVAEPVLRRLGASVHVLHAGPDGRNINHGCGSTHPEDLQTAVVERSADAGLAFDGDADRVLAVDAAGTLVDGDEIIAVCALDRHGRGRLANDEVVVTVMANLGFRLAMAAAGIGVVETAVGDRYVLEALEARGAELGGEQSGHVVFRDLATTGDGLLTGVQLLDVMVRTGRTLSDLAASAMTRLPQVLVNVRVAAPIARLEEGLAPDLAAVRAELGERGRVLVRPSGTEPLVRVMVEADDRSTAQGAAERLAAAVARLG